MLGRTQKKNINIPLSVPSKMQKVYVENYLRATKESDKFFLFACDHKIEHLNKDFYGEGVSPNAVTPEHMFKIASFAPVGAFATQLGLISLYASDYKNVNYVVKLNSKTNLVPTEQKDPLSLNINTVEDVVEFKKNSGLSIVGIGYTIYLGSEFESSMLRQASRAVLEAHQNGLIAILWIYPRGKAIKSEQDADLIAGATGVACALGADFVKVNPPEGPDCEQCAKLFKQAVLAAGRTKVICAGGSLKDKAYFLQTIGKFIHLGGINGVAIGRNIYQRSLEDAIDTCKQIDEVLRKNF